MKKEIMVDMYISTNPSNTFLAITPLYDEQGKRVKNTCKLYHRELGELIIKGSINTLGKKLIESMEEKNNFTVNGYGKNKV